MGSLSRLSGEVKLVVMLRAGATTAAFSGQRCCSGIISKEISCALCWCEHNPSSTVYAQPIFISFLSSLSHHRLVGIARSPLEQELCWPVFCLPWAPPVIAIPACSSPNCRLNLMTQASCPCSGALLWGFVGGFLFLFYIPLFCV